MMSTLKRNDLATIVCSLVVGSCLSGCGSRDEALPVGAEKDRAWPAEIEVAAPAAGRAPTVADSDQIAEVDATVSIEDAILTRGVVGRRTGGATGTITEDDLALARREYAEAKAAYDAEVDAWMEQTEQGDATAGVRVAQGDFVGGQAADPVDSYVQQQYFQAKRTLERMKRLAALQRTRGR